MCQNSHNCLLDSMHVIILAIHHCFSCDKFVTPGCKAVLSKLCVAFSTVVCHQLDLKQYLTLAIYSLTNYVIEAFDQ